MVIKKIYSFVAVFFIICSLDAQNLVVLFTHDLHSNFYPFPVIENNTVVMRGGYARLATALKHEKTLAGADNCITVDAGDFTGGTLFQTIFPTHAAELVTMKAMGYDVVTLGNHDVEYGPDKLAQALHVAQGRGPALVASNMKIDPSEKQLNEFEHACKSYPIEQSHVITKAGMKIGIFGVLGKEASLYAPPLIKFEDYIACARRVVADLRTNKKVDMVICLSHSGLNEDETFQEDLELAQKVPGIDVIISGHKHAMINRQEGLTNIVACGCYGQYLGRLELGRTDNKTFFKVNFRYIPIEQKLKDDAKTAEVIKSFELAIDKEYLQPFGYVRDQVVAYTPSLIDTSKGLRQLILDAHEYALKIVEGRNFKKPDLVLDAVGHVRSCFSKGNITIDDVFRMLPLGMGPDGRAGYPIVTFWLTGKEIKQLLEIETTVAPIKSEMHLMLKGMRLAYDSSAPEYHRVTSVKIEGLQGLKQLDGEKLYRVCTSWHLILLRDYLKKVSHGVITFVPKNDHGKKIEDAVMRNLCVRDGAVELKSWYAVALYLKSFPQNAGIPEVPSYQTSLPHSIVELSATTL